MLTLQILSALFLFLNKYYIRKKNPIGWIHGIIGAIVITVYFYLQIIYEHKNLWIMIVLDVALVVLMTYGYLLNRSNQNEHLKSIFKKWNITFKVIVLIITISVCSLFLIEAITSGLVMMQFFFSVGSLFGTLLLAFDKKVSNIIGWLLYVMAHAIITYVMFKTGSPIIAIFQILSIFVAVDGIIKEIKK